MRVELTSVTVVYEGAFVPALNGVSLTIPEGAFAVLTGPTGAGKTTLLRLLLRELLPSSGTVWLDGVNLAAVRFRELQRLRRQIGVVFQDCRLLPRETAYENVVLPLLWRGIPARQAHGMALELFADLGISYLRHKRPGALSGGEQQLVALARALLPRPRLLLADEPTGNIEPATAARVIDLLRRVNEQGTTVILATHSTELLSAVAGALCVELHEGYLVRLTVAQSSEGRA